ncbi:Uncharacterized protein Fot_17596 [Forsythia ovata]|uniref:Uncharacterized protein n=1 Tax=Forsythia ovata TaxID=205694 RepID=A0ABD1VFT3_9LAMI
MSPTSWKAVGLKLSPTVSIYHTFAENQVTTLRRNGDEKDEDGDSQESETDGEEYYSDSDGYDYVDDEEDEKDGKNQVVPWSNSSYIPPSSLSPPSEASSSSSDVGNVYFTSSKRMRNNPFESKDEDGCSSSQLEAKFAASNLAYDHYFQESEIACSSNSFRSLKLQRADTTGEEAPIKSRTKVIISSLRRLQQDANAYSMDEVKQSMLLTMELENTRLKAQEEIKVRDCEISQLKDILSRVIQERDEAQNKCQNMLFEKLLLQQQQSAPHSGISSIEDDPRRGIDSNNGFSSSDCEESIVSSPLQLPPHLPTEPELELPIVIDRPLPEKGKLLQAVMKAGPLLQNLLLAGPLPQWRHPPPPLDTYQIPPPPVIVPSQPPLAPPAMPTHFIHEESLHNIIPTNNNVNNCNKINKKRGLSDQSSDSYIDFKYQKGFLQ